MKKHIVLIRFHYPADSKKFDWRFAYFKAMVLPRILAQKNKDFDIGIRCNPVHAELFKALSPRIITFGVTPAAENRIKPGYEQKARRYFIDFVPWCDVVGLQKYQIQTAIDSDDLILRDDFIDEIENTFEGMKESAHVSFTPFMFHVPTLRTYRCPLIYGPDKGSPFYSVYQPKEEGYIFAYDDSHLIIGFQFKRRLYKDAGFCAFSIHNANSSTHLYAASKQILI